MMDEELRDALTSEITRLSTELRNARSLLAAAVLTRGEALGSGRYRMSLDRTILESVDGMPLRVIPEPNSGAVLLRLGPPLSP